MDLAIFAALAATGFVLNTVKPRQPNPTEEDGFETLQLSNASRPEHAPLQNLQKSLADQALLEYNEDAIKRFQASFFPYQSGIIAPQYSQRTQGLNPASNQRRHDLYTGKDAAYQQKKDSQPAFFEPRQQFIDSSGREGNSSYDMDQEQLRQSLTHTQQNTLPFEQIKVGTGIGTDKTTADGFHYGKNRVMPVDPYSHKSKDLPGRLPTTGGAVNANRSLEPFVQQNRPARVYSQGVDENSRRHLLPQKAIRSEAQASRGQFTNIGTQPCHADGELHFGGAIFPGSRAPVGEFTRVDDRTSGIAQLNVKGMEAPSARSKIDLAAQNRETDNELLNVKYHTSARTLAPMTAPRETGRDAISKDTDPRVLGPAGPAWFKGDRDLCSGKQLLRQAKRATYKDQVYVPGVDAGRTQQIRNAMLGYDANPYVQQYHKLRRQCPPSRAYVSHMDSYASRGYAQPEHLGKPGGNTKKITGEVQLRSDFDIGIQQQLEQNPFSVKA